MRILQCWRLASFQNGGVLLWRWKKNNSRRFKGQVAPVFDNLSNNVGTLATSWRLTEIWTYLPRGPFLGGEETPNRHYTPIGKPRSCRGFGGFRLTTSPVTKVAIKSHEMMRFWTKSQEKMRFWTTTWVRVRTEGGNHQLPVKCHQNWTTALPETKQFTHEDRPSQKEMIVFQPSIFRCHASFREGTSQRVVNVTSPGDLFWRSGGGIFCGASESFCQHQKRVGVFEFKESTLHMSPFCLMLASSTLHMSMLFYTYPKTPPFHHHPFISFQRPPSEASWMEVVMPWRRSWHLFSSKV